MAKIKPLVNQAVMRSWSSLSSVRTFYIPIQPLLIHNMNDSEYIMTLNVRGSAMKNLKISVFGFKKYKKRRGEKRKRGKRNKEKKKFYVQPDNENKLIIFFTHFLSCYFISIPLLSFIPTKHWLRDFSMENKNESIVPLPPIKDKSNS